MKVLVVSDYAYSNGGIEQFVLELLSRATSYFECHLLTWTHAARVPPDFSSVTVVEYGDVRRAWEALDRADFVLVVTSFNVRLLARTAGDYLRLNHTPALTVVQTSEHSDPSSSATTTQEVWLSQLISESRVVVAVSAEVASGLAVIPLANTPMVVIENAARLKCSASAARERRRVSFIGRPHPQKGFHFFERLAEELRDVGLRFSANTVSLQPSSYCASVEYSCNLTDDELLSFFQRTDLLVAPYLRADGLPLALLEAINCGVPVIGFDSPGVAQLLGRHHQPVIAPTYSALKEAVVDWMNGKLLIEPPTPGSVPSWDVQIASYIRLIEQHASISDGAENPPRKPSEGPPAVRTTHGCP